jgi:hypothetical protein
MDTRPGRREFLRVADFRRRRHQRAVAEEHARPVGPARSGHWPVSWPAATDVPSLSYKRLRSGISDASHVLQPKAVHEIFETLEHSIKALGVGQGLEDSIDLVVVAPVGKSEEFVFEVNERAAWPDWSLANLITKRWRLGGTESTGPVLHSKLVNLARFLYRVTDSTSCH